MSKQDLERQRDKIDKELKQREVWARQPMSDTHDHTFERDNNRKITELEKQRKRLTQEIDNYPEPAQVTREPVVYTDYNVYRVRTRPRTVLDDALSGCVTFVGKLIVAIIVVYILFACLTMVVAPAFSR